jgi:hypothetical protein
MVVSTSLTSENLNESDKQQEELIKQITDLQNKEKELYVKLETMSAAGAPVNEQEQIINKINDLSDERIALFNQITAMYNQMQTNVANTRVDLVDQMTVVGVVEQQLNASKASLNELKSTQQGKMRMVEINTYYGKQYQAHTELMKLIIMICIPLLILAILRKKNIIPNNIAKYLISIIIVIGVIVIARRMWDLAWRDNMNYDEYDWAFDPADTDPTVWEYDKEQLEGSDIQQDLKDDAQYLADSLGLGCIGENCCGKDMVYNSDTNQCEDSAPDKESFVNGRSMQTAFIAADDANKGCPWGKSSTLVKPFSVQANFASV